MAGEERARPTTPVRNGFVEIDDSRTFLVFGAHTESMVGVTLGEAPQGLVRADLTGKWNRGAKDRPVLVMRPETAREWAEALLLCADAAEADLAAYLNRGTRR